jgi:hypothetical protein
MSRQGGGKQHGVDLRDRSATCVAIGYQPVRNGLRQYGLHIVWGNVCAAIHQGSCFGCAQHGNASAGAQAL